LGQHLRRRGHLYLQDPGRRRLQVAGLTALR
jgi:hypothetical protein